MPNSNATTTTNPAQGVPNANGTYSSTQQIPINHHHASTAGMDMPQGFHHPHQAGFGSPSSGSGGGRQSSQFPSHFQQGFGFDPDIDDMFSDAGLRSQLGRMRADPFGTFGSRRPRRAGTGGGIPKATDGMQHDDFFERLPPEFRQYIPDGFGSMRRQGGNGGNGGVGGVSADSPRIPTQQPQYYQTYVQPGTTPPKAAAAPQHQPQSPMRNVCDAAIQTEDPSADRNRTEVDGHHLNADTLNHHGLRNTVDMGVRTPSDGEGHNSRSHSAPPQQPEQNYPQDQQGFRSQGTGTQRNTPPPSQQRQYPANQQPPRFPKAYNPQTYQSHPQQPATPQTPGGSYIRTIPIFVEGRSEPLINHKDIPQAESQPNQNQFTKAPPQTQQYQQPQHQQQQHQNRPTPINTHQQPTAQQQQQQGPPPATPHTMESINKIQDIQRDVLNLMGQVEKFSGVRSDKEYAYLDEMLTRNLLKLDTIDTQGKESIRLARKEAIKCIQASINVLEAKAEENAKTAQPQEAVIGDANKEHKEPAPGNADAAEAQPIDVSNVHEAIPLPPPESLKTTSGSSDNVPASNKASSPPKENSPETTTKTTTTTTNNNNETVTKSSSGSSAKGESVTEAKSE